MIAYDALQAGRLDEAGRGFEEVIAVQRKHGDIWSLGILLTDLAGLRALEGRHDDACACTQEAMSVVLSIRDRRGWGGACRRSPCSKPPRAGAASRMALWRRRGDARGRRRDRPERGDAGAGSLLGACAPGDRGGRISRCRERGRATPFARIMEKEPGAFASA